MVHGLGSSPDPGTVLISQLFNQYLLIMSKLTEKQLHNALKICARQHSTKLTLNHLCSESFVPNADSLVIQACCHSVIAELIANGYIFHLSEYGLSVDKIGGE